MKLMWCAVALLFSQTVFSADPKTPVQVSHTGTDDLGKQLMYRFTEEIRKSSTMELVEPDGNPMIYIVLQSVSLDGEAYFFAYSAVFSIVHPCTGELLFETSSMGMYGKNRIQDASNVLIVATAENAKKGVDRIRRLKGTCSKSGL